MRGGGVAPKPAPLRLGPSPTALPVASVNMATVGASAAHLVEPLPWSLVAGATEFWALLAYVGSVGVATVFVVATGGVAGDTQLLLHVVNRAGARHVRRCGVGPARLYLSQRLLPLRVGANALMPCWVCLPTLISRFTDSKQLCSRPRLPLSQPRSAQHALAQ